MTDAGASGADRPDFPEPEGFRLLSSAGKGPRSHWIAAEQIRLGRMVAMKYLLPAYAASDVFVESFLDAGRQAAGIVHPAALHVINVFPAQKCIAMQWCQGLSFRELTASLPPARAAAVGEVVMDCLSSLHATGRCHGNLSPGNLFLGEEGNVWVEDFFHPATLADGKRVFTSDRRYIAPEILHGAAATWFSDVFSLGWILTDILDAKACSQEFGILMEAMRSIEPSQRGGSPEAVLAAFRRVRRLEEVRVGVGSDTIRRKRMYRRVPAEFDVALRQRSATPEETASILMKTRDIGESGVFVETDDDRLRVGSILELDFSLKGVEGNIHAFGVVRWRSSPPMPRGVGVQFVEVERAGLSRLRRFLAETQSGRSTRRMPPPDGV